MSGTCSLNGGSDCILTPTQTDFFSSSSSRSTLPGEDVLRSQMFAQEGARRCLRAPCGRGRVSQRHLWAGTRDTNPRRSRRLQNELPPLAADPRRSRTMIMTPRASSCRSLMVKCQIASFLIGYPSVYAHVSTICYQHAALLPLCLPPAPVQPLLLFFMANRRCQLL